nr:MAG TPA_asm: hypothetical protein [Caudoviricetes sp.]
MQLPLFKVSYLVYSFPNRYCTDRNEYRFF